MKISQPDNEMQTLLFASCAFKTKLVPDNHSFPVPMSLPFSRTIRERRTDGLVTVDYTTYPLSKIAAD